MPFDMCEGGGYISAAWRPAVLCARYTNRLNPENNIGIRNVALPPARLAVIRLDGGGTVRRPAAWFVARSRRRYSDRDKWTYGRAVGRRRPPGIDPAPRLNYHFAGISTATSLASRPAGRRVPRRRRRRRLGWDPERAGPVISLPGPAAVGWFADVDRGPGGRPARQ